jgi:hypothetical protein
MWNLDIGWQGSVGSSGCARSRDHGGGAGALEVDPEATQLGEQ